MADRTHAYALVDTLTAFRTAMMSSARQLRATIDNAPAMPAADQRTRDAIKACAGDVKAAAAMIEAMAAELEARL